MTSELLTQRLTNVGICIYCGGKGETDEHVMPLALGGEMILRKASCNPCRAVTSQCESHLLKHSLVQARACLNYPSRGRTFATEVFPIDVVLKDGTETTLSLSNEESLGLTQFLELAPPAFLKPSNYTSGSVVTGAKLISFGKGLDEFVKKHNVKQIKFKSKHPKNYFERMTARIAYCYVVAFWGYECLEECLVLPAILGRKDDIGQWVGCDLEGEYVRPLGKLPGRNAVKLWIFQPPGGGLRHVLVQLKFFAGSDAPEYIVVVGTLKPGFDSKKPPINQ